MALVLGVEMSALSTKVEVRDAEDGKLLVSGQAPHEGGRSGRGEYDPATGGRRSSKPGRTRVARWA